MSCDFLPNSSLFAGIDIEPVQTPVIAAVSGGPDSMALLGYLEERNIDYVICHVNYHKRQSALRDENIVRNWARTHGRPLWILHPGHGYGNFQAWARQVRYDFFVQIAHSCKASEIWLGHHQDDLIETWMLQKKRQSIPEHYGLQQRTGWQNLSLVRPFLNIKKANLQTWCERQKVQYGLDESNESDAYLRNQLRHQYVQRADDVQRQSWLAQIDVDNKELKKARSQIQNKAQSGDAAFLQDKMDGWKVLSEILFEQTGRRYGQRQLKDLQTKLAAGHVIALPETNLNFQVIDHQLKSAPRDWIPFYVDSVSHMEALCKQNYEWQCFRMQKSGRKIESFALSDSDFPLLIRPPQSKDVIAQRFGHKKISRLLIDRKIPALYRPFTPVVESQNGIVFVSFAGCDPAHYMENAPFSMLKLPV